LFSAFWDRDAELPTAGTKDAEFVEGAVNSSAIPERDLSVQLSGWMLMEAAHTVAGDGSDTAGDGSDTAGDESDIMDGGDAVQ
jgi:predicted alpha-1,6-mannanase (GH76 family)